MKVHLCCGDVYLNGYVNVDVVGSFTTEKIPIGTTIDRYYESKKIGEHRDIIVDIRMDLRDWGFKKSSVTEFLMISAIEHFTLPEAREIIENIYKSLKKGGKFKFDFPDLHLTMINHDDYEMIRLIYGSSRNPHKWGYTAKTIKDILEFHNWKNIQFENVVKHDYPMIGVIATK